MRMFIKSFLIILLLYKTNSIITFEVVHYTVDNTNLGVEPLFLTIFSKAAKTLAEIKALDVSIFDFNSNCETKVTAISIDDDPYTKNDCQYYFRVNYRTNLNRIILPDTLIGNNEYKIIVNKALIKKEFSLSENFNFQNNNRIVLIEKYFDSEDSGSSIKIETKVPICKKIFADEGSKYEIVNVNSIAEYNCTFIDIDETNYLNNKQNYTCLFKSGIKQVQTNDINFDLLLNDNDILYFISPKVNTYCPGSAPPEEEGEISLYDMTVNPDFIYYSNERNALFYIFYKINNNINLLSIKIYAQLNKGGLMDISSYCVPGLSRYYNYGQFTCSVNLVQFFQKNKEYLINSIVYIYVNDKKYKSYIIKRGFEQPYYKDFVGTMIRNYTKNGEPI